LEPAEGALAVGVKFTIGGEGDLLEQPVEVILVKYRNKRRAREDEKSPGMPSHGAN
jgi:hypothetical protein